MRRRRGRAVMGHDSHSAFVDIIISRLQFLVSSLDPKLIETIRFPDIHDFTGVQIGITRTPQPRDSFLLLFFVPLNTSSLDKTSWPSPSF